jgi:hypothetical protein
VREGPWGQQGPLARLIGCANLPGGGISTNGAFTGATCVSAAHAVQAQLPRAALLACPLPTAGCFYGSGWFHAGALVRRLNLHCIPYGGPFNRPARKSSGISCAEHRGWCRAAVRRGLRVPLENAWSSVLGALCLVIFT